MTPKELIGQGRTALGIEFGSTRIKGVLIDYEGNVLAVGEHVWENHLENGIWTYPLSEVDEGLRSCYSALRNDVKEKYGIVPETFGAIGVSAMMHGYIALDKDDRQLAPFQTWMSDSGTPRRSAIFLMATGSVFLYISCIWALKLALSISEGWFRSRF